MRLSTVGRVKLRRQCRRLRRRRRLRRLSRLRRDRRVSGMLLLGRRVRRLRRLELRVRRLLVGRLRCVSRGRRLLDRKRGVRAARR